VNDDNPYASPQAHEIGIDSNHVRARNSVVLAAAIGIHSAIVLSVVAELFPFQSFSLRLFVGFASGFSIVSALTGIYQNAIHKEPTP